MKKEAVIIGKGVRWLKIKHEQERKQRCFTDSSNLLPAPPPQKDNHSALSAYLMNSSSSKLKSVKACFILSNLPVLSMFDSIK